MSNTNQTKPIKQRKPKKPVITARDILETQPDNIKKIAFRSFIFNSDRVLIKVRVKDLDKKNVLFMWNLDKNKYVSSLFPVSDNKFFFDYREKGTDEVKKYELRLNESNCFEINEDK